MKPTMVEISSSQQKQYNPLLTPRGNLLFPPPNAGGDFSQFREEINVTREQLSKPGNYELITMKWKYLFNMVTVETKICWEPLVRTMKKLQKPTARLQKLSKSDQNGSKLREMMKVHMYML